MVPAGHIQKLGTGVRPDFTAVRVAWLQSFEDREERDSATAVPDNYEPPNFQTVALQHTNVQLTWDADDDGRKRALSAKRATQTEIREDDFKARAVLVQICSGSQEVHFIAGMLVWFRSTAGRGGGLSVCGSVLLWTTNC